MERKVVQADRNARIRKCVDYKSSQYNTDYVDRVTTNTYSVFQAAKDQTSGAEGPGLDQASNPDIS